ncbi:MAG: glycine cleavage system protein GcvH [candidate division NC10 bacterium]|nr:glycine cleavage system protein GcvH [candidate division NC10 bacterium]
MSVPEGLKYTKEHEWVKVEGDKGRVGITHYAQDQLGDVVFVELPKKGRKLRQMETFGVVESVKAVSDLFSPLGGEVVEINGELERKPELVNADPYGKGWMILVKIANSKELNNLLSASEYTAFLKKAGGGH